MSETFTATARRIGMFSAAATIILLIAYAVTLAIGLLSLESPDQPIGDPMFTILEILILALMPVMIALMAAVHAWAPRGRKTLSLISLIFMSLLAGLTCCVHFAVLTLSRRPEFAGEPWQTLVLSFRWPSVVYALDILGWDIFFAISMLSAAAVFSGSRLALALRATMIASGVLSLAGLLGVVYGDMQLRNIGIIGYVGVFLVVALLLGVLFKCTPSSESTNRA